VYAISVRDAGPGDQARVTVDGAAVGGDEITLVDDGRRHEVVVPAPRRAE
jgi:hypothetical protein